MTVRLPVDTLGAFVGGPRLLADGAPDGPLSGVSLAVKDLFDVAGTVTGAGNPTFAAGRSPATAHAWAVEALVAAGASVVGKTVTDELAYSLSGTNVHHGTPRNVAAPGRIPGGSSAGSAAAVAGGLVDLALGTDTGGSIRVPASYCGVYGWRPTHGAVAMAGVVPLAPSFDTAGLFASDPALLAIAAAVLLGADPAASVGVADPDRLLTMPRLQVPAEPAAQVSPGLAAGLRDVAARLGAAPTERTGAGIAPSGMSNPRQFELGVDLDRAVGAFRTLQGWEAWRQHGPWITAVDPSFGPGIAARFAAASRVTEIEVATAQTVREEVAAAMQAATADGTVLVLPASAGPAPEPSADGATKEAERGRTLRICCLAGLAGAPVVVAPLLREDGLPVGVAFVGAPGTDLALLRWVAAATQP